LDLRSVLPEQAITAESLAAAPHSILEGDIILLHTGWSDRKFGDPDYFLRSPFLTDEAAYWLAARKPKAVGFDFFQERAAKTIDFQPKDFTTHRILMEHGITIIEGVTNLGALEGQQATFFAAPLKLAGAEAAPARLFAIVED
jgi:kynurenine formamidase